MGGLLDGQVKRHPYCPVRWAHNGQEYKLVSKQEGRLTAEYIKCRGNDDGSGSPRVLSKRDS